MRPITTCLSVLTCLAVAAVGASSATHASPGGDAARAVAAAPPPSSFSDPHPNPWFPLRPGTVWRLRGVEDGRHFTQRTVVTHRHRMIAGVRATVVRDVVRRADGSIEELTHDWYALSNRGAVWYFGEATATYDRDGNLIDREGSWEAGVDGARAGKILPAHPQVTDAFRQEYKRGVAEDQGWIVELGARVRTPAVDSDRGLRSLEWNRLEPRVVSQKLYVRGYGEVSERNLGGGQEAFELVGFKRP